jgi:hypothetical protein
MNFTWNIFIDYWFWILLVPFLLLGTSVNRDHTRASQNIQGVHDLKENLANVDFIHPHIG